MAGGLPPRAGKPLRQEVFGSLEASARDHRDALAPPCISLYAPPSPDMGHKAPAPIFDALKPETKINRVAVHRRQVDSGGVSEPVMGHHHVARFGHQLHRLTERNAGHAVPQCLGSVLAEVSFQNVVRPRPDSEVPGELGPHRTEIYPDEHREIAE
jgi:hypothetical protein